MGGSASHVMQRAVESCVEGYLDEDERFQNFVMLTFDDEADAQQQLPKERLLKALVAVYELIAAVLPPAGRRLVTRAPEQADVDAELAAGGAGAPLDFDRYDALARGVFRRIAVDRGRRLLVGVASGCVCVAVLKATLKRTPLVGPPLASLLLPMLPAGTGPALGVAACAYLPEERLRRVRPKPGAAGTPSRRLKARPPE